MDPIIIIGTGLAGYSLAREFRKLDRQQALLLITADDGRYYSKPMLSNALAAGKQAPQLAISDALAMEQNLGARILTRRRVQSIDPRSRTVTAGSETLSYSALALATGAQPIRLPFAGDAAGEILSINNLQDYTRFRQQLKEGSRVAIIGPGLIGCEFANDLALAGHPVRVIGPDPYPVSTLLPQAAGEALQEALAEAGIEWHLGQVAKQIEHRDGAIRLTLDNGSTAEADLVLSAIGLRPDITLASASGLECNRGIVVDRTLHSSEPGIYALGDSAEVAGLNLPFVAPLMLGARALARTLSGTPTEVSYPALPVVVKTPSHPVVVAPPALGADGDWVIEHPEGGVRARFLNDRGDLLGFALTGSAAAEKQALSKELPPLLA